MNMSTNLLSRIPSVDRILKRPGVRKLIEEHSRAFILGLVDVLLQNLRAEIKQDSLTAAELEQRVSDLESHLADLLRERIRPSLTKVINASGVVIYTNAGRSPLAPGLANRVSEVATSYTNLEYDLDRGTRGHRDIHIETRVKRILDCEAGTVCNNAAAAVLLILNTLAQGRKFLSPEANWSKLEGPFVSRKYWKKAEPF